MSNEPKGFTPALGDARLTPLYDFAIAALTRERTWRSKLVRQLNPKSGEQILDIGCGTGSLAIRIKKAAPEASVIGVDPDSEVLSRARGKALKFGVEIGWFEGFYDAEVAAQIGQVDKAVSSLVLHQVPLAGKKSILSTLHSQLVPGGELHIADYGLQRTRLMRALFRRTVQAIDGVEDTQPNADGILPELMEEAGFRNVIESEIVFTATGSISLYKATSPLGP